MVLGDSDVVKSIVEGRITPKQHCYSHDDTDPVFLRAQNIEEGFLDFSDTKRLTQQAFQEEPKAILAVGDIVLTIDGALLGIAAVHRADEPACCISNHMVRFVCGQRVMPEFLSWFLNAPIGQRQIKRGISGSAIPGLRTDAIGRFIVSLPPLPVQRELVGEMVEARASRKAKLAEADALLAGLDDFLLDQLGLTKPVENSLFMRKPACFAVRRSQLGERLDPKFIMFGGHNPISGTRMCSLGELIVEEPMYGLGARAVPVTSTSDPKYIRITDFDDEGIVPGNLFVTAEYYDSSRGLKPGDILFARTGATAGKTYIHTEDLGDSVFAGYCIRFRFNESLILPWYVYFYTKSNRYKTWVQSMQRPSGQPNINKEEFKSFTIPAPHRDIQEAIIDELQHRHVEARRLRDEAARVWEEAKARFEAQLLGEGTR